MIAIRDVTKTFAARSGARSSTPDADPRALTALSDVSLDVGSGEILSLLGPSGCGKTTLLRIVAGLMPLDTGSIVIDGEPVEGPRRDRCMVFQHFGLLPWRTVIDNVAFALEADGMSKPERHEAARSQIEAVGLRGFENHYPHELSGGMQQRVGIARALTRKPTLLLMDEPFAALDMQTREDMQEEFLRLWLSLRTTVLFVTHSIDEALVLSHRIAVFTPGPGRVREVIEVPFTHEERTEVDVRSSTEFVRSRYRIRELLRH